MVPPDDYIKLFWHTKKKSLSILTSYERISHNPLKKWDRASLGLKEPLWVVTNTQRERAETGRRVCGGLSSLVAAAASASPVWLTVRNLGEITTLSGGARVCPLTVCFASEFVDGSTGRLHEGINVPKPTTRCGCTAEEKGAMDLMRKHTYLSIVILISKWSDILLLYLVFIFCFKQHLQR